MVTEAAPPKVSARIVPATASGVLGAFATPTVTMSIRTATEPRALVSETRTPEPPMLVCTTLRTVRSAYPVGRLGTVPDAEAAHVPTQSRGGDAAGSAKAGLVGASTSASAA